MCGGIAQSMSIDPLAIRLAFFLAFVLFGFGPILYLLLWLIVPNEV